MNFIAGQAGQPGKDIVAAAGRIVVFQVTDRPNQRLLNDFLTQMTVAADAIQAKVEERVQRFLGQAADRIGTPCQGSRAPVAVEDCTQLVISLVLALFTVGLPSAPSRSA